MTKKIANMLIIALLLGAIVNSQITIAKTIYEHQLAGLLVMRTATPASGSSVAATPAPTKKPKPKKKKIKKVYKRDKRYVKCNLNFRKKPTTKSKIKKVLSVGTKVKRIYITNNGWVKIRYKKSKGFVKNKYLTKKKPKIVRPSDTRLTGVRKRNADRIAKTCIKYYKTYGVLPSVSVAQAFVETGIGTAYNNGNLWGISSNNYGGYSSIEAGCVAYLKVINNGYYKGAPFAKNYKTQIRRILYGGYCDGEEEYISDVIHIIQKYNLTDYDKYL